MVFLKGLRLIFGPFEEYEKKVINEPQAGLLSSNYLITLVEVRIELGLSLSIRKRQFNGSRISCTMKKSKHNDFVFFYLKVDSIWKSS